MPNKQNKPCNHPRCRELTTDRFCEKHRKQDRARLDKARPSSTQRGYGYRWQQTRRAYLKRHSLCVICMQNGKITQATVVDHKVPHKGNTELFNDVTNLQSLCKHCHDVKTATQDGGGFRK